MNYKSTWGFIKISTFVVLTFIALYTIRIDLWVEDGIYNMLAVFLSMIIPILLITTLSLFSQKNEFEIDLKKVFKETPVKIKLITWFIFICFSIVMYFARFAPLPSAIFFNFFFFSWVASFVGIFSQNLVLQIMLDIIKDDRKTPFNMFNRYLNVIMFGYIYILFGRIASLPWYIRKPAGIVVMIGSILATMAASSVFNL